LILLIGGTLLACQEDLVAPGVCPEFCPPSVIDVLDTVLLESVSLDSTYIGYFQSVEARAMQVASPGSSVPSRGLVRFLSFPETIQGDDLIAPADSFEIQLIMVRRNVDVPDLQIVLHRAPSDVATQPSFTDLDPIFHDSTEIGVISVANDAVFDTLRVVVAADAFPAFIDDERVTAIGIEVRGASPTFATLGTIEGLRPAAIARFARTDSSGVEVLREDSSSAASDTFVRPEPAAAGADTLVIGGEPTSRSLLRVDIPPSVIDSTAIVEAILYIVPVMPAFGAPADTFRVQANALSADFGPKSPLVIELPGEIADSLVVTGSPVTVGRMDTVAIDITAIVASWQADSSRPRSVMLRTVAIRNPRGLDPTQGEASTLARLLFGSSRVPNARPYLRVTYVPPFAFEGN
jgi:hypothetical protein